MDDRILAFIKAVRKPFSNSFLEGNLYFNTLEYFNQIEKEDDNIGDYFDGAIAYSEDKVSMTLFSLESEKVIKINDVENLKISRNSYFNMFCLYSIWESDCIRTDGGLYIHNIEKEFIKKFNEHDFYIIERPNNFIEKIQSIIIKEATDKNLCKHLSKGIVKYKKRNKEINSELEFPFFIKREKYKYQKEFRFVLEETKDNKPIVIKFENISDFVTRLRNPNNPLKFIEPYMKMRE